MKAFYEGTAPSKEFVATAEKHDPLDGWNPDQIKTWDEWLAEWNKTHRQEVRLGLLHCGLNTPGPGIDADSYSKLVNFYLELADGHNEPRSSGGGPRLHARRELAQKAFSMLCQKVFKNTSPSYPSWCYLIESEQLVEHIFWFFGMETDMRIGNLPEKPHEREIIDKFLDQFINLCIQWLYPDRGDGLLWPHLKKFRPQLLKLMCALRQLDKLRIEWITDTEMEILKILALEDEWWMHQGWHYRRKAVTIEEAYYAGSRAAETYLLLKIKLQVRDQLATEVKRKTAEEAFAREYPNRFFVF